MDTDRRLWITILAGGVGSRFWPASTPERPKQLLPLASARPLIVDTVQRARALVPDARIRILAGETLARAFRGALPDLPEGSFLLEPRAKGTCPVLTWAAHDIALLDPDAILVSLHADHLIRPLEAFQDTVRSAARVAAAHDVLVTVAASPDRIETGYGHIQPGEPLGDASGAFGVARFHEKPDLETARRYTEAGYLWNTGIFVWRAAVFLDEVARHAPDVAALRHHLDAGAVDAFFEAAPTSVVDTAVLEKSDRVACVAASFSWDDVGSWESLTRTRQPDAHGNVLEGDATVVDGAGNVVWSEQGRVVVWGLDDVVAVRSGGTTVILPRARAPELKRLLASLDEEP